MKAVQLVTRTSHAAFEKLLGSYYPQTTFLTVSSFATRGKNKALLAICKCQRCTLHTKQYFHITNISKAQKSPLNVLGLFLYF